MKERPILFSAPMVRAILAGTKTQTRRLIKPVGNDEGFVLQDYGDGFWPYRSEDGESGFYRDRNGYDTEERIKCPYGRPGDRLWVREAWRTSKVADELKPSQLVGGSYSPIWYEAQDDVPFHPSNFGKLRPSMFMPRWASRITLEVTAVKVERLQDISEADSMAEGIKHSTLNDPRVEYRWLWESINGPGSWDANPWAWCVSFLRVSPNTQTAQDR